MVRPPYYRLIRTGNYRQHPYETVLLNTRRRGQVSYQFSHASFDHSGKYLYAWSYGRGENHAHEAYVWRMESALEQRFVRVHFGRYPSVRALTRYGFVC